MAYLVVPLRLESQRVPRKILEDLKGRPLCVRVFDRVLDALIQVKDPDSWTVLAAVDSVDTRERLEKFLGKEHVKVVITDPALPSGTDRVHAAVREYASQNSVELDENEVIVNIQGDMPMMSPKHTAEYLDWCLENKPEFGTLAHTWPDDQAITDSGHVKVILNTKSEAIYFSRFAIPYSRVPLMEYEPVVALYHVGMYAYQLKVLSQFCAWEPSDLEKFEGLEQLRALVNAQPIRVFEFENSDTESSFRGVDTAADLAWARSQEY